MSKENRWEISLSKTIQKILVLVLPIPRNFHTRKLGEIMANTQRATL